MSADGGLRRATREANERRLARLREIDPHLGESAERALRAVEARARRDEAEEAARGRPVRLSMDMTCYPDTARAVEAYAREQPHSGITVRIYPAGGGDAPQGRP